MTLQPAVFNISRLLTLQIERDLYVLRDKLEAIVNLQNFEHISLENLNNLKKFLKETVEIHNILKKRHALIQVSQILLQLKDINNPPTRKIWLHIDNIEFLKRQAVVYASLLEGVNFLAAAENENDLAVKLKEYVNGFELIATTVEDSWQFLSGEVCKQIEIAANTILQIELEIRHKKQKTYLDFEDTAKNLRRSVTSTLWMLNRLVETHKIEEVHTLQNSFKPFLKHKGETPEEQLLKNQDAMKLLKSWIEEEVSEAEAKERERYFETFQEIMDNERPSGYKLSSTCCLSRSPSLAVGERTHKYDVRQISHNINQNAFE
ncbi:hypothetical protein [Scytonema hofmannii]|uniref:hypothetical protein n=1 Tax=Scytonema hofmannii TaxID=34078 RepID=UPI000349C28F|nr:hypothetical protein [Scytonema hofmannii]